MSILSYVVNEWQNGYMDDAYSKSGFRQGKKQFFLSCADVPSDDPAHGHNPGTY
jgi:hypothetical protein